MDLPLYRYKAEMLRVIDGDTIDAKIALGFDIYAHKRIRFFGIDTPESRTRDLEEKKRGLAAKARVKEILQENNNKFSFKSHEAGKFGRCLGEIFVETLGAVSLQETLINEGHGTAYFGGKRK